MQSRMGRSVRICACVRINVATAGIVTGSASRRKPGTPMEKGAVPQPFARPGRPDTEAAAARIRDVLVATPLVPLHAHGSDPRILIKPEILQPAGSFKIRGIYHAVLRLAEAARRRGLSTVSAGNTAKALAWCGRKFGVPVRSLMPDTAPATKIDAVRALGGTPVLLPTAEVFPLLRDLAGEVVLVSEEEVRAAIRLLAAGNHVIAEGSGALATAAAMKSPIEGRGLSVCLVTGGSIDTAKLAEILSERDRPESGNASR